MTVHDPTSDSPFESKSCKPLIGITMGDPSGIGAETIVKALADPSIRSLARFVVFGIDEILAAAADAADVRSFWFSLDASQRRRVDSGVIVIDHKEYEAGFWMKPRPTLEGGRLSLRFLDEAIEDAKSGAIDAIVTGPINKTSWRLAGCRHPGHTEKLAEAFGAKRVTMAFVAGDLRVALASAHVGLFELRNRFTIGAVFQPIDLLHQSLRDWFGIERPRIAVAGLNPHAGENGAFGDEEARIIEPAIQMARNAGIEVEGPFPADTLFIRQRRTRYDGIVAMYHDQGLIPVKMMAFDQAVNVTLGLPIIRTSVDHGTAFDIAGANAADPGSMKAAITLACRLAVRDATVAPAPAPQPAAIADDGA
ncbi:MAG: 4-hydroxythreonine-4-phosphate dehydrogenase PdxA [Planctomycetes bacterium]|nr:4-hydroxythreonine-4-phosphate dehydrogenase PdxA [Planctomycetota bacterium]MBI3833617.1 4-hydroxythreonine-4-phosphate dehydrogenase PdxA [Planctomycetota bacterium]